MTKELNEIRKKIRIILNQGDKFVIELGDLTQKENMETALKAARLERKNEKNPVKKGTLSNLVALIYLAVNRLDRAEKAALTSAANIDMPRQVRAFAYCLLARVHIFRGEFSETEALCKKALALVNEEDNEVLAYILNTLGGVQFMQEKYHLALEYDRLYLKVAGKNKNKGQFIGALNNAALSLRYIGREDEAVKYLKRSRKMAVSIRNRIGLGFSIVGIGCSHLDKGNFEKAIKYLGESLEIFEELGNNLMIAYCHANLARTRVEMGKPDLAVGHAEKAVACAEEVGDRELLPLAYQSLGAALAALDDPGAGAHFEKSLELYQNLRPDGEAKDFEFAMLGYARHLFARNDAGGADWVRKAYRLLKKRPPAIRVIKARKEAKQLLMDMAEDISHEKDVQGIETDRDNLKKVVEITKAMNSETEMEKLLERIIDTAIETSGAERGFIVLVEGDQWNIAVQRNFFEDITNEPDYPSMREIIMKVISTGTAVTVGNIQDPESLNALISRSFGTIKGFFVFPLAIKEKVIGAVYLDSRFVVVDLPQDAAGFMLTLMEQAAQIIEKARLYEEVQSLSKKLRQKLDRTRFDLKQKQHELESKYSYNNIIGKSPKMQELYNLLDKIIKTDLPVYIYGESGTGKELVARAIHYSGTRKKNHFEALNCAAIPEGLIESELFGYEKGAFTGADFTRKGILEIADNGTLLMDEIGNMSPAMQQKLLRVLQEKEIRRIGGKRLIKVNVRIISASNQDPRGLIDIGRFREDLFYRLNVLSVKVPPLKERMEDIPLLIEYFWKKAANAPLKAVPEDLRKFMKTAMNYDWPGNVRELENEIFRMASLGGNNFNPDNMSKHILSYSGGNSAPQKSKTLSLPEMEKDLIISALKKAKGNKARAARFLHIPRTTLSDKIKRYAIFYREVSP